MKDYKLIKILKQFSKKELDKLALFANSPYFNFNSHIAHFLTSILQNLNSFPLNVQKIWSSSFDEAFSEPRLSKKLHESLIIVENFLAYENFHNAPFLKAKSLLTKSVEKNLESLVLKALKNIENELNSFSKLNFEYYSNRFELINSYYNLAGYDRKIALKKNKSSRYLQKADKILNELFLSEKLRLAHLLRNDNSVSNKDEKLTFIDQVLDFAETTSRKGSKPMFYKELYQLSEGKDVLSQIKKLHSFLSDKKELFDSVEFRDITNTLLNETIREFNRGDEKANILLFEIYKIGLENQSFLKNGKIEPDDFRNIVAIACAANEYNWALYFIEEFSESLNVVYRNTAVAFTKARVYWYQKDYNNVIEQVREVEFEDLGYNLISKLLLLTSYYELEEYDALDSLIKSFNVFLRRKKSISEKRKTSFKNFNKTLQDIVRVKERRDKVKLRTVRERLESKTVVPNKAWFLEKVEELEIQLGVKPKPTEPKTGL